MTNDFVCISVWMVQKVKRFEQQIFEVKVNQIACVLVSGWCKKLNFTRTSIASVHHALH